LETSGDIFGREGEVIILAVFAALLVFETMFPLRRRKLPRKGRFILNFIMTAFVFLIGGTVVRATGLGLAGWADGREFGLLHIASLPINFRFMLGFLLMDLSFYYWHRLNHEWPLLWRFHNVHHIDPDLDVTTSFRFHFVEVLYSTAFRALQVLLIGVSPVTYAAYEIAFTCETAFHHSNLRLPIRVERALCKILVTPRMHGIHHSQVYEEANANYGTIFRWWDIFHGTLRLGVRQSDVDIGVPAYSSPEDNTLSRLTALPLTRQRDYWMLPDGTRPVRLIPHTKIMME
jgi:sterol desaturase/sphingolipid hydroxylase (fatty acid hydroxylase superfamily)